MFFGEFGFRIDRRLIFLLELDLYVSQVDGEEMKTIIIVLILVLGAFGSYL